MGADKELSVQESGSPSQVESGEVENIHELKSLVMDGLDPVFEKQAMLINHAVQTIGMGKVSLYSVLGRIIN